MTQQIKRLKPTLIIALDPFAASFCAEAQRRLAWNFGERGDLIQAHELTLRDGRLDFEPIPLDRETSGASFDLQAAREVGARQSAQEAEQLFEQNVEDIQSSLERILQSGRSFADVEKARGEGVDVVDERVIYLVLSSVAPVSTGVVMGAARLIKWLFSALFADELYTLHALVLLPYLFENPSGPDYATTYALFKKLDDAFAGSTDISGQVEMPFESCWLIDGRNARGVGTRTLAENLAGYADAFAGFLNADPEKSGALPGRTSRGRPPVYSTFGFGELYFPAEEAVARLSATLAEEVIRRAFLGEGAARQDNTRQLLLAAKRFILSAEYRDALQSIERQEGKGAIIWQPFRPRAELREDAPGDYVAELGRRYKEFEQREAIDYRDALLTSSEQARVGVEALLDTAIDRRADDSANGLKDAVAFLNVMTRQGLALDRHLLGEDPQNLITALRETKGELDASLPDVVADHQQSDALLEQVQDFRSRLESLETSLRLMPAPPEAAEAGAPPPAAPPSDAPEPPPSEGERPDAEAHEEAAPEQPPDESPRERLAREIDETGQQLRAASEAYLRALDQEDQAADVSRHEAQKRALAAKHERIERAEAGLIELGGKLREARRALEYLLEDKQQFLRRHFVVRPVLFALLAVGLPLLAALGDIGPAREFVAFIWENFPQVLLWLCVASLIYTSAILWVFRIGLYRQIKEARALVEQLASSFDSDAAQLRSARNDLLHFKYQLFAQTMRVGAVERLIEMARHRVRELEEGREALVRMAEDFARLRVEAEPPASVMRRPLLQAEDIDAYYRKVIASVEAEAEVFRHNHDRVRRKDVRRRPPAELRAELTAFSRRRFDLLRDLSIEEAMLSQRPELIPPATVRRRLEELSEAAEPLLRLRQTEVGSGSFAERDATLWVNAEEQTQVSELYRRICPSVNVRAGDNPRALRVLTRNMHFPAYFVGAIQFYRHWYERSADRAASELPDVLPVDERMRRAQEDFLLAYATGLVTLRAGGAYAFPDGNGEVLGTDRKQIVERLATSFAARQLYAELKTRLERLSADDSVHLKLSGFLKSATDLNPAERAVLSALAGRYF